MVALVRATEGATLDLTSFEEIAGYIGADASKGLSLQVRAACAACAGLVRRSRFEYGRIV